MKKISDMIKFLTAWSVLFLGAGKLLSLLYPASDPSSKECPAVFILLLIFLPPWIAFKRFPIPIKTRVLKIGTVFFQFFFVLFFSLAVCLEIASVIFGEDIPTVFSVLTLICPFFIAYFACQKHFDRFPPKNSLQPEEPAEKQNRLPDQTLAASAGQSNSITALMTEIDAMDGHEFESFTAGLLRKLGYQKVEVTRGSGDQGVDVLAEKDGVRYAFQCKCYASDLGNKPAQEVHTGRSIYRCHVGVVVTNRYFTQGAKEAAEATGTLLWDRDKLEALLESAA